MHIMMVKIFKHSNPTAIMAMIVTLASLTALAVNTFIYQYPGNNYFPSNTTQIIATLFLMYAGFYLLFGQKSTPALIIKEIVILCLVFSVIALATNVAQFTPFNPIDNHLFIIESKLHINTQKIISWINSHRHFSDCLSSAYNSLSYQMCYIPLVIILTKRFELLHEYYFLLLTSVLLGFTFYYFFPTTAPASIIVSQYFSEAQKATGIKFMQIHHHIQPMTINGGLIAMPSFHAIWAWFSLYLVRKWPIIFHLLLPVNVLLTAACVLLGWHYFIDLLGSIMVVIVSHIIYLIWTDKKMQTMNKTADSYRFTFALKRSPN